MKIKKHIGISILFLVTVCLSLTGCRISEGQTIVLKSEGWSVRFEVPPGTNIEQNSDWALMSESNFGTVEWVINIFDSDEPLDRNDAEEMRDKARSQASSGTTIGTLTDAEGWWYWEVQYDNGMTGYNLVNERGECRFSGQNGHDMENLLHSILDMN